jgi:rhamnose utilization protein RhaD (predicted bifunctional aldolase and dehydrogenase)
MDLDPIVRLSRSLGGNPDYVLAGGGNTSQKEGDTIAIKASGVQLGTIDAAGFVQLSLSRLNTLFNIELPSNSDEREKVVLEEMLAARLPGQTRRPSVETLLHALFPFRFVVHLHPALINGMLCSREALSAAQTLFENRAAVLPYITPGYTLADAVRTVFETRTLSGQRPYKILFLQNHGVFVSADTAEEVKVLYDHIFATLKARVRPLPPEENEGREVSAPESAIKGRVRAAVEAATPKFDVRFFFTLNSVVGHFLASPEAFLPLSAPFTPDHIVYAGAWPLFVSQSQAQDPTSLQEQIDACHTHHGELPKVLAVQGVGIFGLGRDSAAAERACLLFTDAAKIAWYAEAFGGAHPMESADIEFIRNWEVEKYRSSIASKNSVAAPKQ